MTILNRAGAHTAQRVSTLTVSVLAAAFAVGVAKGAVAYARRSPVLQRHVAGTNAIVVEVVLAIAAVAVVAAIEAVRWRRHSPSPWLAPFSARAMARVRQATRLPPGKVAALAVPTTLLLLVIVYCPYRIGAQVIGGLDPNATVNAWGGPGYAGAMAAHYLDCLIGLYLAASLLSLLLPPPPGQPAGDTRRKITTATEK
jgi:hypothetical protein